MNDTFFNTALICNNTGYCIVNQPIVRETSIVSINSFSPVTFELIYCCHNWDQSYNVYAKAVTVTH